jgi:hypothetical protein
MSTPERNVLVKLEVSVPVDCAARLEGAPTPSGHMPKGVATLNVQFPTAGGNTMVKTSGPYVQTGTICTYGTAISSDGSTPAQSVWLKIYPGGIGSASPNPTGATVVIPDSSGKWKYNGLATAACASGTGAPNTLEVWANFISDPQCIRQVPFQGICSTMTDCDSAVAAPPAVLGAVSEETGPESWKIDAKGFVTRQTRRFNKNWILKLQPQQGRTSVWNNGGNGRRSPLVELRYDRCCPSTWSLRFQLGDGIVEYVKPAAEWNIVGRNVFTVVTASGLGAGVVVPASLEAVPA